jgi:hypothetical protein
MVRFIPQRLKSPYHSDSRHTSTTNSRNPSPMRSKGDTMGPEGRMDTGLVLTVVVLRVSMSQPRSGSKLGEARLTPFRHEI